MITIVDQIRHIGNNRLSPIFFPPGETQAKGLLVLLYLGLEGVTEVDTDPKGRFVSFKVTPSNDRVLCVSAPSGRRTREQLARGRCFKGLQNPLSKLVVDDGRLKDLWRMKKTDSSDFTR